MHPCTQIPLALVLMLAVVAVPGYGQPSPVENVTVTGRRVATDTVRSTVSVSRIRADEIADAGATHVNEIAWRAPGAWVSRGSGQEHLTAIRSPVLTGAGSCGAFLFLEDGVPVRPAGLCNVNQLFEINTAQAHAIEIARGPVSAVWGANGLHGAVNVINDAPRQTSIGLDAGADDYFGGRLSLALPGSTTVLLNATHDGGFRADSGYDQAKLNVYTGERLRIHFAAVGLQQETAGFVLGDDAYRDDAVRETNPNPEAYRDAEAQRLTLRGDAGAWRATGYARHSRMAFLQHFLPGQPLERNGQHSLGVQLQRPFDFPKWPAVLGIDLEAARGTLRQSQSGPTQGSPFLQATRPAGRHYDYSVDTAMAGFWISVLHDFNPATQLELAARAEALRYDYDNRLADGNLRDDGTACAFGGCIYNRPADRADSFASVAPRIALTRQLSGNASWRLALAGGFRPPQATELYRLQRGQDSADLEPEKTASIETGLSAGAAQSRVELTGFWMKKTDVVLRDADGFNVSDGQTLHYGFEAALDWRPAPEWRVHASLTQARHRYDFDRSVAQGEQIRTGADVDTAPRHLGSARLAWHPRTSATIALEWVHMGSYFMDAANTMRYPGHDLLNLRVQQRFGDWRIGARLMNLSDRRYAERADFAFGNARYFPGRERALFLSADWSQQRRP